MKLHQLISAAALALVTLPFAAQAQGDTRSQEWLQSVRSTETRAEVIADIGDLPRFGEGDAPRFEQATRSSRSRDQVRAELARLGPIVVGA